MVNAQGSQSRRRVKRGEQYAGQVCVVKGGVRRPSRMIKKGEHQRTCTTRVLVKYHATGVISLGRIVSVFGNAHARTFTAADEYVERHYEDICINADVNRDA